MFRYMPTAAEIGRQKHAAAMKRFETEHEEWLGRAREMMLTVITEKGNCSSDDCWERCPPPADAHPSLMGALFRDDRFLRITSKKSQRESANGRWISVYERKDRV